MLGIPPSTYFFTKKGYPPISNHYCKNPKDQDLILIESFIVSTIWPVAMFFTIVEKYQDNN